MPTSVDNWTRSSAVSAMVSALFAAVAAGAAFYQAKISADAAASALSYNIQKDSQDFGVRYQDRAASRLGPANVLAWMSPIYHQRHWLDADVWKTMEYNFCFGFAKDEELRRFWTNLPPEKKKLYGAEFSNFADSLMGRTSC